MVNEDRRKFLGICLGGLTASAAVAVGYPVYRYLAPLQKENSAGKVVIPEQDLPAGGAKFFEYAGSTAVMVRKQGGDLVALSAVCTHLGCIVQWEKEKQDFLCPCHGWPLHSRRGCHLRTATQAAGQAPLCRRQWRHHRRLKGAHGTFQKTDRLDRSCGSVSGRLWQRS